MGTTFVNIGERGFWMRDGILELWLRLLSLHLPEPTSQDRTTSRLLPIRDRWLLASRGYFNGCVPVDLAEAVGDAEGRQVVVEGIRSLLDALAQFLRVFLRVFLGGGRGFGHAALSRFRGQAIRLA